MLDREKKTTLSEQVMEQIATQITNGTLKPGDKLPTERALSDSFKVTRSRIREALSALSLIGLITIKPGDGSYVCDREFMIPENTITWMFYKEINNLNDIYEARKLIESEVIKHAFANSTDKEIQKIKEHQELLFLSSQKNDTPDVFSKYVDEYDLYMGSICGNCVYEKLLQTIILLRKDSALKVLSVPGSKESSYMSREKITQAFIEKDKKKLTKSLNEFYSSSKKFYNSMLKK